MGDDKQQSSGNGEAQIAVCTGERKELDPKAPIFESRGLAENKKSLWSTFKEVTKSLLPFSEKPVDQRSPQIKPLPRPINNAGDANGNCGTSISDGVGVEEQQQEAFFKACKPRSINRGVAIGQFVDQSNGQKTYCSRGTDAPMPEMTIVLMKKGLLLMYNKRSFLCTIPEWGEDMASWVLEVKGNVNTRRKVVACCDFPVLNPNAVPQFLGGYLGEMIVHIVSIRREAYMRKFTQAINLERWLALDVLMMLDTSVRIPNEFEEYLHLTMFIFTSGGIQCKIGMNGQLLVDHALTPPKEFTTIYNEVVSASNQHDEDYVSFSCKLIARVLKLDAMESRGISHREMVELFCINAPEIFMCIGKALVDLGMEAQLIFMNAKGCTVIAAYDNDPKSLAKSILTQSTGTFAQVISIMPQSVFRPKILLYLMVILKAHVVECYRGLWLSNLIDIHKYPRVTRVFIHCFHKVYRECGNNLEMSSQELFLLVWKKMRTMFLNAFILDACESFQASKRWQTIARVMRMCRELEPEDEAAIDDAPVANYKKTRRLSPEHKSNETPNAVKSVALSEVKSVQVASPICQIAKPSTTTQPLVSKPHLVIPGDKTSLTTYPVTGPTPACIDKALPMRINSIEEARSAEIAAKISTFRESKLKLCTMPHSKLPFDIPGAAIQLPAMTNAKQCKATSGTPIAEKAAVNIKGMTLGKDPSTGAAIQKTPSGETLPYVPGKDLNTVTFRKPIPTPRFATQSPSKGSTEDKEEIPRAATMNNSKPITSCESSNQGLIKSNLGSHMSAFKPFGTTSANNNTKCTTSVGQDQIPDVSKTAKPNSMDIIGSSKLNNCSIADHSILQKFSPRGTAKALILQKKRNACLRKMTESTSSTNSIGTDPRHLFKPSYDGTLNASSITTSPISKEASYLAMPDPDASKLLASGKPLFHRASSGSAVRDVSPIGESKDEPSSPTRNLGSEKRSILKPAKKLKAISTIDETLKPNLREKADFSSQTTASNQVSTFRTTATSCTDDLCEKNTEETIFKRTNNKPSKGKERKSGPSSCANKSETFNNYSSSGQRKADENTSQNTEQQQEQTEEHIGHHYGKFTLSFLNELIELLHVKTPKACKADSPPNSEVLHFKKIATRTLETLISLKKQAVQKQHINPAANMELVELILYGCQERISDLIIGSTKYREVIHGLEHAVKFLETKLADTESDIKYLTEENLSGFFDMAQEESKPVKPKRSRKRIRRTKNRFIVAPELLKLEQDELNQKSEMHSTVESSNSHSTGTEENENVVCRGDRNSSSSEVVTSARQSDEAETNSENILIVIVTAEETKEKAVDEPEPEVKDNDLKESGGSQIMTPAKKRLKTNPKSCRAKSKLVQSLEVKNKVGEGDQPHKEIQQARWSRKRQQKSSVDPKTRLDSGDYEVDDDLGDPSNTLPEMADAPPKVPLAALFKSKVIGKDPQTDTQFCVVTKKGKVLDKVPLATNPQEGYERPLHRVERSPHKQNQSQDLDPTSADETLETILEEHSQPCNSVSESNSAVQLVEEYIKAQSRSSNSAVHLVDEFILYEQGNSDINNLPESDELEAMDHNVCISTETHTAQTTAYQHPSPPLPNEDVSHASRQVSIKRQEVSTGARPKLDQKLKEKRAMKKRTNKEKQSRNNIIRTDTSENSLAETVDIDIILDPQDFPNLTEACSKKHTEVSAHIDEGWASKLFRADDVKENVCEQIQLYETSCCAAQANQQTSCQPTMIQTNCSYCVEPQNNLSVVSTTSVFLQPTSIVHHTEVSQETIMCHVDDQGMVVCEEAKLEVVHDEIMRWDNGHVDMCDDQPSRNISEPKALNHNKSSSPVTNPSASSVPEGLGPCNGFLGTKADLITPNSDYLYSDPSVFHQTIDCIQQLFKCEQVDSQPIDSIDSVIEEWMMSESWNSRFLECFKTDPLEIIKAQQDAACQATDNEIFCSSLNPSYQDHGLGAAHQPFKSQMSGVDYVNLKVNGGFIEGSFPDERSVCVGDYKFAISPNFQIGLQ